jgi:hypothetical protein
MAVHVILRRLVAIAALPVAVAHCSGRVAGAARGGELASPTDAAANAGAVSVTFVAPEAGTPIQFSQVSYAITGPTVVSGSAAVGSTLDVIVSGLVPSAGYAIGLEAISTDGSLRCSGSAPFTVTAGATTSVVVPENCAATGAGGGAPTAGGGAGAACCAPPGCAAWQTFQIQPAVVAIGAAAQVSFSVEGHSPADLAFVAATGGGVVALSSGGGPVPSGRGAIEAVCLGVGPATIQLVFSDGADPAGCPSLFSTVSSTLECVAAVDAGGEAGDGDGSDDAGDGGPNDAAGSTDGP